MTYNEIADELNYTGYGAILAQASGGEPNDLVYAHTTISNGVMIDLVTIF